LIWLRLGCSEFHFVAAKSFLLDLALRELSRWESLGSNLILDFRYFRLELSIACRWLSSVSPSLASHACLLAS
jgi:hypothetical protein